MSAPYPSEARMRAIADAYADLPSGGPPDKESLACYQQLAVEIQDQFMELPVGVEWFSDTTQPYLNSKEMFDDIEKSGVLKIFTGGTPHPFFPCQTNNMFRAVHDYYGHYVNRNSFGPKGEFRAWQFHCKMFGEPARPALTAETLGQGAWFWHGPFSNMTVGERPFAEQKAAVLDRSLWEDLL